ncbi:MAG: hypothetical protein A2878_00750 [Candidatus Moranbacteria bacterium RIFCSPHIGHO2_01_FULL_54_31]|nr:MAG: hypothetical protein A2878_00750 [Candidatus Moranbacteria bacterium RIFCSPHIGHO2_01_FULL_54_31]
MVEEILPFLHARVYFGAAYSAVAQKYGLSETENYQEYYLYFHPVRKRVVAKRVLELAPDRPFDSRVFAKVIYSDGVIGKRNNEGFNTLLGPVKKLVEAHHKRAARVKEKKQAAPAETPSRRLSHRLTPWELQDVLNAD